LSCRQYWRSDGSPPHRLPLWLGTRIWQILQRRVSLS